MHAACLEAEIPGSVSKFESVQGATIACVTPGTRSDSVRLAHSHAQRLMTLCITKPAKELILKPSKPRQRNRWFTIGPLRNTTRCIEAAEHQCLDVASIDVVDKEKGHFARFLTELEKFIDEKRPSISICVENALELRFQGFLRRRPNYVQCNPPDVCFIRRSPESHQLR